MAGIIEIVAATAWLVLAIDRAVNLRKWNRKFSELYDTLKEDLRDNDN